MDPVTAAAMQRLRLGPTSSPELSRALRVSQSTVSRVLRVLEQDGRVLRIGKTRGARYALLRNVADAIGSRWPVYRVDEAGTVHELGAFHALEPDSYYTNAGPARIQHLAEGIPYFLQDARPADFSVGR